MPQAEESMIILAQSRGLSGNGSEMLWAHLGSKDTRTPSPRCRSCAASVHPRCVPFC